MSLSELMSPSPSIRDTVLRFLESIACEDGVAFYARALQKISLFRFTIELLSNRLPRIKDDVVEGAFKSHSPLPSELHVVALLHGFHEIGVFLPKLVVDLEDKLSSWLDDHTNDTKTGLEAVMASQVRVLLATAPSSNSLFQSQLTGSGMLVKHLSVESFCTLGVGKWLNDEIINHFVEKWCSQSRVRATLGLNTWFSCRHMFQDNRCLLARRAMKQEDERLVERWCRSAAKQQGVSGNWERIFIPINENNTHWYSACINFESKRIDIYDSLREVYLDNERKPTEDKKNFGTMQLLMSLAEVIGRLEGKEVLPWTTWQCEPHTRVAYPIQTSMI
ncbi:hypothetical protein C8R42DRAFT_725466 [Lentinula raphanica]|nr:hypothetical protein C8R42DRAFT_725466 [Lentinula raphanica]